MFKVVAHFKDAQDNRHEYNPGDTFPRAGLEVSEERLKELSTDKNGRGKPLIASVAGETIPKPRKEPEKDFMNPPEVPEEFTAEIKEPAKPKRSRRKRTNAD